MQRTVSGQISRRLFVVLLGNDARGKGTIVNGLLSQGLGQDSPRQKCARQLTSPFGQTISSVVYIRSYQEYEKAHLHYNVEESLRNLDSEWNNRQLIIMLSHVGQQLTKDGEKMICLANSYGFDTIGVPVVLYNDDLEKASDFLKLDWDERWTLWNQELNDDNVITALCSALGRDLWARICRTMFEG